MATKRKKAKRSTRKQNGLQLGQDLNKRQGQRGYVYLIWDGKRHEFTNVAARARALATLQDEKHGPRRTPKKNPSWRKTVKKTKTSRRKSGMADWNFPSRQKAVWKGDKAAFAKRTKLARKGEKVARKRNGSELASAAKMFKKFHGKQATKVKTVEQIRVTPSVLADCGRMVDLVVATDTGVGVRLTFKGGTRLACTGNGGQLYFVGGDQAVNLRQFPNARPDKDQVDLGEAVTICYHTSKDFHNFEKSDYEHEFGEEGGARPLLSYDVQSKRLYFVGGDYIVKREGIVN